MATSTEDTLRAGIATAIQAIAVSDLGFDDANGNVKEYLLEHVADEKQSTYLVANVGSAKKVRCWAVHIVGNDDWFAVGNITQRTYFIDVVGYYEIGQSGAGVQALITGARKVRNVIRGMGISLGVRVDKVDSTGAIDIDKISSVDPSKGEILRGTMRYVATKKNPDF